MICQSKEPLKLGQVVSARPRTGKAWALALQALHPLQGTASIDAIPIIIQSALVFLLQLTKKCVLSLVQSNGVSS